MAANRGSGDWIKQLLAEDFSAGCKEDRFCVSCAAAFCHHCCGAHHRGEGHEVVVRAAGEGAQQAAQPGSSRDSFCVSCGAGFSAARCAHHSGHQIIRIDVYDGRYCARCTGSEPWFHAFENVHRYNDEKGDILVPLHPRSRSGGRNLFLAVCPDETPTANPLSLISAMAPTLASGDWLKRLLAEDFSAGCKEDRFCVPCAAAFCHHCCGTHHRGLGHEVIVCAAAKGTQQAAQPGAAAQGHSAASSRDSFCVSCGAGFSATLCAHHSGPGHETFRIDVWDGRYCARCTGSEPWFHAMFDGIDTYNDEKGHILVPLHPRPRCGGRCGGRG